MRYVKKFHVIELCCNINLGDRIVSSQNYIGYMYDEWMDGWMGGWMDRWMGGWMGGWMDRRRDVVLGR
jgi:hypothetical protein